MPSVPGGVMAATAAEVQQATRRLSKTDLEQAPVEGGFLNVIPDGRQQQVPVRRVTVEPRRLFGG